MAEEIKRTKAKEKEEKINLNEVLEQLKFLTDELNNIKRESFEKDQEIERLKKENGDKRIEDEWITVINLCDNIPPLKTTFNINNRLYSMARINDSVTLRYNEFEELLGKYPEFFEKGVLALSEKNKQIAILRNVPYVAEAPISKNTLDNICKLSNSEIETMYDNLSTENQNAIVRRWLQGYFSHEEGYEDKRKINLLNTISDGGLEIVIEDMKHKN